MFCNFKKKQFSYLESSVLDLNNIHELKKVFAWTKDPVLDVPDIFEYQYIEDINERRIRDAESLGAVCCNVASGTFLEIGTAAGFRTALMAVNAPAASVFTVNMLPEDAQAGQGGQLITEVFPKDKIGEYYRGRNLQNIKQIFANTARWTPDIGRINVAFIDGCHDADFVYNDSAKILKHMKTGDFLLWHDFNLELCRKFEWIAEVCLGVERLYKNGLIRGKIFHVRDSWVGVYRLP